MTHALGSRPNGQAGAPVVGVERTQIGSAADVRQRGIRETDTKAAAKQKTSGIPTFEDNPIAAIGLILQEFAAGVKGTEGPVAKANKGAIEQQAFQLRKDAQTLQAIKFGIEQLEAFPGGNSEALISTIGKISEEAAAALSEISKEGVEKSREMLDFVNEHPEIFPGFATFARLLGMKKTLGIFGGAIAEVVRQKALAPGEEDAAQKAADREVSTALAKQKALVPGASQAAKDRAQLEVDTALRKQQVLASGRIAEAGATAETTRASIDRIAAEAAAKREPLEDAAVRAGVMAAVKREPIGDAAARAGAIAQVQETAKAKFREPKSPVLRSGLGGAVINIDNGEVVTPGSLNVIDQATGKPQTIPIRSAEDLKNLTDRLASGEIVEGRIQRTREITDIPGAVRILLPDLPTDMTPEQARLKGINIDLSDKALEGLLESKGDVEQLDRVFTEIQGIISETPAALGAAGFIARTGNTIIAQLPLISVLVGVDFEPELLVTENYESTFREIGVESQRLKSATVGAAYALALAQRRRGGRMAQQDVERAMVQISGQDPKATIQVLQDLKQRTAEGFQTRTANLLGRSPPRIEVTPSPAISKRTELPRLSTQEEVDKLAPGTRFFWVPTKEVGTKD